MSDQHSDLVVEPFDFGAYSRYQLAEQKLNDAITHARISESLEKYLEIFDNFYADDVEVSIEGQQQRVRGKARVGSLLMDFLVPLHVLAEIRGLAISIRQTAFPGDTADQTNSSWKLDLLGTPGNTYTLTWRTFRKWNGPRVVYEHHYDLERTGDSLPFENLHLAVNAPFVTSVPAS